MSIYQFTVFGVDTILLVSALSLLVLCLVLFVECTVASLPIASESNQRDWSDTKVAVLVPAHNEEVVICSTLLDLKSKLKKEYKLVVIADNCDDDTAEIARATGATVIERHDPHRRGKGYALDYGLRFLESDPPEVVVFVDADCRVDEDAIAYLIESALATGQPVQATYLMAKPNNPSAKDSISAFAFKVKNLVRFLGLAQLGLPCLLTGTGMAFPWSVIRACDLASSYIVEDMKLGLDLTIAGHKPVFCPQAKVTGYLPTQTQAAKSQRTRWEHGHLKTLLTYVPMLMKASVKQKRFDLFMIALDLCVPPLSLLVAIWLVVITASFLAAILGATSIPLTILSVAGCFLFIAIITAWAKFGRTDLPLRELLAVPFYVFWKIPLYLKFLVQPQNIWVRTERELNASDS
jgi:cellulose synthase/poly-beta-1,6-N-acetylglucosamine synthase-like glycosyltransferase